MKKCWKYFEKKVAMNDTHTKRDKENGSDTRLKETLLRSAIEERISIFLPSSSLLWHFHFLCSPISSTISLGYTSCLRFPCGYHPFYSHDVISALNDFCLSVFSISHLWILLGVFYYFILQEIAELHNGKTKIQKKCQ